MPWEKNKGGGYSKKGQAQGGNVKNPDQYEALRRQGKSKESAARITNASGKSDLSPRQQRRVERGHRQ